MIDSVVAYLASLRNAEERIRRRIGRAAIAAACKPFNGVYERMCLLSLFTAGREFDSEHRFERLYEQFSDVASRREIVLAFGRAGAHHWFLTRRRDYQSLEPWSKRAFLAAFSCVPVDAAQPFYRSLRNGSDVLERAIIRWATDSPFS